MDLLRLVGWRDKGEVDDRSNLDKAQDAILFYRHELGIIDDEIPRGEEETYEVYLELRDRINMPSEHQLQSLEELLDALGGQIDGEGLQSALHADLLIRQLNFILENPERLNQLAHSTVPRRSIYESVDPHDRYSDSADQSDGHTDPSHQRDGYFDEIDRSLLGPLLILCLAVFIPALIWTGVGILIAVVALVIGLGMLFMGLDDDYPGVAASVWFSGLAGLTGALISWIFV